MQNTATRSLLGGLMLAGFGTMANAQLTTTQTDLNPTTTNYVRDGVISPNEYGTGNTYSFTGGGTGFGGTVGAGTLYMDFDATDLKVGLQLGGNLNDIAVIYFDTRPGGFTDATMSDGADGSRRVISNLARDTEEGFPFLADYALAIGNFGTVTFELAGGLTDNSLIFQQFDGTFTGNSPATAREVSIAKSAFNIGGSFDFFVAYGAESGFLSNESIPAQAFNAGGNPGNGDPNNPVQYTNFNRFQAVPSPAAWSVFALGGLPILSALRRRYRK